jgi:hypothetical protein
MQLEEEDTDHRKEEMGSWKLEREGFLCPVMKMMMLKFDLGFV